MSEVEELIRERLKEFQPFIDKQPCRMEHVIYGRVGEVELYGTWVRPVDPPVRPCPAAVYFHGGFLAGDRRFKFSRHAAYMTRSGWVGLLVAYRYPGLSTFPTPLHMGQCAVRFLRAHAAKYDIDPGRIAAVGGSAGGHQAGMLATTSEKIELEGAGDWEDYSSAVQAAVLFNPCLDFRPPLLPVDPEHPRRMDFLGGTYDELPDRFAEASPNFHAGKDTCPCLVMHGDADEVVSVEHSRAFKKILDANGVKCEYIETPGGTHGWFNFDPAFGVTLKQMESWLNDTFHVPKEG